MSNSKKLYLMLTEGEQEALIDTIIQERYPNELGAITPPVTVEHEGVEYILVREWHLMKDTFVYKPATKINVIERQDENQTRRSRRS